ncbi:MAG: GNAT family N-acetyltransferase [Magnetococcales bacterium]|nr:GNAT family N-acetyltransferase [Magnetococcales bacterium]
MSIHVTPIPQTDAEEPEYGLVPAEGDLIHSSAPMVQLLRHMAPRARAIRLEARDDHDHRLRGLLHCFIQDGPWGPIANSLPFFGTHGGPVVPDQDPAVRAALVEAFRQRVRQEGCVASTLITSPMDPDPQQLRAILSPDYVDARIGLITPLPAQTGVDGIHLMALFHSKSRNMVRKALQGGFRLDREETPAHWAFLEHTHGQNMARLNAATHPEAFFRYVSQPTSGAALEKRLYTAFLADEPVAGLLLFVHHKSVEYAVPVIQEAHRASQPLSFLIWHAMMEAVESGLRWWNWGGTWLSQESLYRFKKRLGGVDHPYYYYVNIGDPTLLKVERHALMREYPFFYAYPFGQVEND